MGAVNAMVEASSLNESDTVLEIGPGKGVLTDFLLKKVRQVVAVEKDDRLIPHLTERFEKEVVSGKLKIIHADILEISPKDLGLLAKSYKLVANIPYYITGELIQKFLETDTQPILMTLMLQKEVARRIVAKDGKESILSLSVKSYGVPKYIQTVSAGCFIPKPSVDSAILLVDNISDTFFKYANSKEDGGSTINQQKFFFSLIKSGFAHKRKKLIRNLETITQKTTLENAFSKLDLTINTRAEDLSLEQWKTLAHLLK